MLSWRVPSTAGKKGRKRWETPKSFRCPRTRLDVDGFTTVTLSTDVPLTILTAELQCPVHHVGGQILESIWSETVQFNWLEYLHETLHTMLNSTSATGWNYTRRSLLYIPQHPQLGTGDSISSQHVFIVVVIGNHGGRPSGAALFLQSWTEQNVLKHADSYVHLCALAT